MKPETTDARVRPVTFLDHIKPPRKTLMDENQLWKIAQVVHEANRAWQKANGQPASPPWSKAPRWMRDASREAVIYRLDNPGASPGAQHEQWMAHKLADGWKLGLVKDGARKTHPLLIPYSELPEVERRKDALVAAVIDTLAARID